MKRKAKRRGSEEVEGKKKFNSFFFVSFHFVSFRVYLNTNRHPRKQTILRRNGAAFFYYYSRKKNIKELSTKTPNCNYNSIPSIYI